MALTRTLKFEVRFLGWRRTDLGTFTERSERANREVICFVRIVDSKLGGP